MPRPEDEKLKQQLLKYTACASVAMVWVCRVEALEVRSAGLRVKRLSFGSKASGLRFVLFRVRVCGGQLQSLFIGYLKLFTGGVRG